MNDNLLGRVIALFLIAGAAYGARSIAKGSFCCGTGTGNSCMMEMPAASAPGSITDAAPAAPAEAAPEAPAAAAASASPKKAQ